MRWWTRDRRRRSGAAGSPAFAGATIGDLVGPTGVVDPHGRVAVIDGSWWLEWGVIAEERWRIAHDEVAVRQSRIADAPVYETRLRVPGGDVIQRVASAGHGTGRVILVEFENASPNAVAVACVGRVAGDSKVFADVDGVELDDLEWIRGARPAGGVVACLGDPWPRLVDGPSNPRATVSGREPSGGLVLAVPHRQTVVVQVLLEGEFPDRAVRPEEVASGWRTLTADALSIDAPDSALAEAWSRIVPDLVVEAGSYDERLAAEAAAALDVVGLVGEADRARLTVVAAADGGRLRGAAATAALRALASKELLTGDRSGLEELAGVLAAGAGSDLDPETLLLVATALDRHSAATARDARRAAADAVGSYSPVSTPAAAAERLLATLAAPAAPGVLDLLPTLPDSWRGQPVDVRGFGSVCGRVSFSVRWHGDRPALLWDRLGGPDDVELRCPGLDPTWRTDLRRGEALLAAD